MNASDTSTQAYDSIRDKLNEKQRVLRRLLLQNPAGLTDRQIARQLGWEINQVTGRRNELVDIGVVISAGKVPGEKNTPVHIWKLKYPTPTTPSPKVEATSTQATLA